MSDFLHGTSWMSTFPWTHHRHHVLCSSAECLWEYWSIHQPTADYVPPVTLIHHRFHWSVLCGFLLLLLVRVGCMLIKVDQANGNQREHRVRDDQVISNLHLYRFFTQFHFTDNCENHLFCQVGHTDIYHEQDKDQHRQTSCQGERKAD